MLRRHLGWIAVSLLVAGASFAQQQQYPPNYPPQDQGQYPPQQQQPYPQGQQYPQAQQYPQGQYPQPQYPQAQQYPPGVYQQPPALAPQQLDQLVASVALYPDGLLAHVLTAATFPDQIPPAAGWANQHAFLHGDMLARAIREDSLPWDISVQALLPFPQVLSQLAQYMQWTTQLGDAVLVQRNDVMEAVQRMRARANQYGYFRDPEFSRYERVELAGPYIGIYPTGPDYFVPVYSPRIFFEAPRRGFFGVFNFGPAVSIGGFFGPWGWGNAGFGWREHTILIDRNPWNRGWQNRGAYQHPYAAPLEHRDGAEHREGGAWPRGDDHRYNSPRAWENRGHDDHRGEPRHDDHRDHR